MTEKENRVRQCEINVSIEETKLREAKSALENGYAKAKAEMEREYDKLKLDVERATLRVTAERAWLEHAKAELERGFELS